MSSRVTTIAVHIMVSLEKRLLEELVTDEAAVAALSQAKIEAQLHCWEESYLFGTDDSGWDPVIRATLLAQEETKLEALIPYKKKLVFGKQQGGPCKADLPGEAVGTQKELHRRWMAKKRAQLRAVIIFHRWREARRAATAGAGSAASEDRPAGIAVATADALAAASGARAGAGVFH